MDKSLSIVIPCKNEEKYIAKCIDSFLNIDYPNELLEIILVDGNSTDKTIDIINTYIEKFDFIKLVNNKKEKTPFALNLGINNSTKEYVLIASAHSKFEKNYIKELFKYLDLLNADVVGGIMKTEVLNKTSKSNSICSVLSNKFGVGNSMFRIGVNEPQKVDTVPFGIYKKSIFDQVGLYNENLIRNHDIELSKRLISENKSIYLIPSTSCTYYAREDFKSIAKNNYRNGKWNLLTVYITKNISSLSLRHFIPLFFTLSILLPIFLMPINIYFGIISIFSFSIYLLLISFISSKINSEKTSIKYLILTFLTLHFSYGLGSFHGLLRFDKLFVK